MSFFKRFIAVFHPAHLSNVQKENSWKKTLNFWVLGCAINAIVGIIVSIIILAISFSKYYTILINDIATKSDIKKEEITFTISEAQELSTNIKPYIYTETEPSIGTISLIIDPSKDDIYEEDKSIFDNAFALFLAKKEIFFLEQYEDETAVSSFAYDIAPGEYKLSEIKQNINWKTFIPWSELLKNSFILWGLLFVSLLLFIGVIAVGLALVFLTIFKIAGINIQYRHVYQTLLQAIVPVNTILIILGIILNTTMFLYLIVLLALFTGYYAHIRQN